jgi:uncharacterized protein
MKNEANRREFITALVGAGAASGTVSGGPANPGDQSARPRGKQFLQPFDYDGVRLLDGRFRKQFENTRQLYLKLADDDLLKGFRERAGLPAPGKRLGGWYSGDEAPTLEQWPTLLFSRGDTFNTFGQWLSGMSRMAKATGDSEMRDKAVGLMLGWAKTIQPDGFFYYSRHPITPHYIYDKTVCGLVDMMQYLGEERALPLLDRITDWAIKNLDRSRKPGTLSGGQEWYTVSENLYRAFLRTGDPKYRSFGDVWNYPSYWGMFTRSESPNPFGFHAYSHVNTLSSAAMTYAVTGDSQYLSAIRNAHDWFQETQCYANGGFGPDENLVPPDGTLGKMLESTGSSFESPCCSWAVFKLGRYLLEYTGEARFGDWMERLLYNGIGAALPPTEDGRSFYYSDFRVGGGRKTYYSVRWPCCSGTYIQAVADYHNIIYFHDADSLYVNLFVPSEVTWNTGRGEVRVEQRTAFPESEVVELVVNSPRETRFALKVRVPGWADNMRLKVNGQPFSTVVKPGQWATIERSWKAEDKVTIELPMHIQLVPVDKQHPRRVAAMFGPVAMVRRQQVLEAAVTADPEHWLAREGPALEFQALTRAADLFVPYYSLGEGEPYVMYFDTNG